MRKSIWKRALSLVLSLAMLLTLVPAFDVLPEAEAAEGPQGNYITLPITIRDFAADGMLFEYNEVGATGTTTVNSSAVVSYAMWDGPAWDLGTGTYTGFRIYDPGDLDLSTAPVDLSYWYCVIVESSTGTVKSVLPYDNDKTTYDSLMEDGYYSVWVWTSDPDSGVLAAITDANKNNFRIDFNSAYIYVGYSFTENAWGDGYTGISYFDASTTPFVDNYDAKWADCLICDSNGNVVEVLGAGTVKDDGTYTNAMPEGGFALFATANDTFAQGLLRTVTEDNKDEYSATLFTDTYYGNELLYLGEGHTKTYHQANTLNFGLLQPDHAANYIIDSGIEGTTTINNGTWNQQTEPAAVPSTLNSGAKQEVYGAYIITDLVGPKLVNGKPIYTQATVEYLANFMEQIMAVPERNADGTYNSYHVEGVKVFDADWNYIDPESPLAMYDLADLIRLTMDTYKDETTAKYGDTIGTYADAKTKFDAGNLQYAYQVRTWCEVAYFLLHSTWSDSLADTRNPGTDGYGFPINRYDSLHMVEAVNEDGDICYVFNAKYDGTTYDYNNGEIYNSPFAEGETTVTRTYESTGYVRGNPQPVSRFDPLGPSGSGQNLGYKMSGDTYRTMTGVSVDPYYDETNYHLSLEGHAQFVYHYDSNQYFTFTGDDDVYLYINGVRVLDLGGGHSISKASIDMNEVAKLCGLEEGGTYKFDFFYMERHGTAANFGIETNIQLADPAMTTTKTGYQNGASTGYNGYVNPDVKVAYSFSLRNDGDLPITNLTFDDQDIGVYFGYDSVVWDNGYTDPAEMYMYVFDSNGKPTEIWPAGSLTAQNIESTIMTRLATGLKGGETLAIYGFKYLIPADKWVDTDGDGSADTFPNTVHTTSQTEHGEKTVTLVGTADWKVMKMQVPYTAFHVYDWVHKDAKDTEWETPKDSEGNVIGTVTLTKAELMQYLLGVEGAETQEQVDALVANEDVYIVRCTASGHEEDYLQNPCVKVNADNSITYTSAKPGMDTVFYEIKGTGLMGGKLDDLAFSFDVFTYGTMDNVYVLDYGLKVKLNEDDFGFQVNDKLTVPENIHKPTTTITALKDNTCVYGDFMIEDAEGVYKSMSEFNAGTNDGEKSVEYWPKNIMNNTDSFKVEIQVREPNADTTKDLKYWGVNMSETVTTAPANVVYYEDDFPGLVYVHNLDNGWVQYETVDEEGNPIIDEYQSADQNSNYGSDPNYEVEEGGTMMEVTEPTEGEDDTTITPDGTPDETQNLLLDTGKLSTLQKAALKAMKQFLGVGGADSNGGVHGLQVNKTDEVMWFEFVGTGFEIISRTTDEQYAVIMVQVQKPVRDASGNLVYLTDDEGNIVYKKDASGNLVYQTDEYGNVIKDDNGERIKIPELKYEVYKHKPVITESAGGDLYQVPIISFTNLDRLENGDKYRVVITAAGEYIGDVEDETDNVKRLLYIDGIRIYNPLLPGQALEYYNPQEAQAKFMEIKQLVKDGEAAYFGLETPEDDDDKFFLVSGISYAENFSGEGTLTEIDNIGEYMDNGPNNELYLNADGRFGNMVAFYLTPKEDVDESARTIQIGAHRKLGEETNVSGAVFMTYGSTRADIAYADKEDANYKKISTGTEMYYTIDVDLLDTDEQGRYLLMIGTNGSDDGETLVLTNLKVSGYKIEKMEDVLKEAYKSGKQEENAFIAELADMYLAVITQNRSMARLITEGNAVLFGYDEEKEEPYLYSRRSYITDLAGEGQRTIVDNQEDYLADAGRVGDFGELKLEVSENFVDMVAFYVKPNANIPESARYIQLGVQGLDFDGTAIVVYGNSSDDFDLETNSKKITGNEEEILDIVVDESWDDGTGHLVIITAGADENGLRQPFALTSLEVCGYTVEPVEMEIRDAVAAEGELSLPIITALLDVWNTLFPAEEAEETPDEEDTVTPASEEEAEELLTGEEAVTEETEPEEAETVAAEPEEAETEATEPEEAESDETEPEETVSEIAE